MPTFSKSGRQSIIDLTFASPELARNRVWRVSDIYTHSDHALIITQTSPRLAAPSSRQTTYKAHTLNTVYLLAHMENVCVTLTQPIEIRSLGAHQKQRVQKNGAAFTEELGKMFDEMVVKFTATKSNDKKVVRHVTQATIDSLHAMK